MLNLSQIGAYVAGLLGAYAPCWSSLVMHSVLHVTATFLVNAFVQTVYPSWSLAASQGCNEQQHCCASEDVQVIQNAHMDGSDLHLNVEYKSNMHSCCPLPLALPPPLSPSAAAIRAH